MKQKFMKKALAVALSTAMVFSASSVAGMQSASAAAKFRPEYDVQNLKGRTEGLQTEISKQYAELED